jgi:hypothetical protein
MSPIQIATPLFITDCNVAWKVRIEKTRLQEEMCVLPRQVGSLTERWQF